MSSDPPLDLSEDELRLLGQVAEKMRTDEHSALRYILQTMLALYEAKDEGGQPVVRYKRSGTLRRDFERGINLPGTDSA